MATVKIDLPDDQAAVLRAKAAEQGLSLENWIENLARQEAATFVPRGRKGPYRLADLVAQCDLSTPLTQEDRDWLDTPPIGREAL